jgi:hypothetical protein
LHLLQGRVQDDFAHGCVLCHEGVGYRGFAEGHDLVNEDAELAGHPQLQNPITRLETRQGGLGEGEPIRILFCYYIVVVIIEAPAAGCHHFRVLGLSADPVLIPQGNVCNGDNSLRVEDTACGVRSLVSRYGRSSQVRSNITRSPRM